MPKVLVPFSYVCELSWLDIVLHIAFLLCPLPTTPTIQNSVLIRKYEMVTPATTAFVTLPRRRQLSSPATDSSYPVPKILTLTVVAVVAAMTQGMAVVRVVAVAVSVAVALARSWQ